MKSPWKSMWPVEDDGEYLVLATSIPARRWSSTGRMFRGASAVRKQLESTPGLVGFSLLARPGWRQYATLSMWTDEASLAEFVRGMPHRQLMGELAPELGETAFVRWTIRGADGRPSWAEALRRLG